MSVTQAREIIVRHHKYAWVLIGLSILIVTGVFFKKEFIQAATYTFTQSSWAGGITANTANHTSNQTGWTEYSATSTNVTLNGSNQPTLNSVSYAFLDDGATSTTPSLATATGGGFSNGSNSSTTVSGSGAGASVGISPLGTLSARTDYPTATTPEGITISQNGASVYVTDNAASKVSMFTRNTSNGNLSTKTDYTTGASPRGVAISPDGTSVYVTNVGSNTVSMFTRNTSDGTLSVKTDYVAGAAPSGVAISPDGTSVYVTNYTALTVSMFTRNTSDGTLSAKTDYSAGTTPWGVVVSPDGTSVYVANATSNTVSMFTRNTSDGTLSVKTDYVAGAGSQGVAISPDGTSVYVTNYTSATVSMFPRNTSDGTLSAKTDYSTGTGPRGVVVSPDGRSVYVAVSNSVSVTVSMFPRNTSDGTLSARTDYSSGWAPRFVAISPDGTSVYLANYSSSNTVSKYTRFTGVLSGTFTSDVIDNGASSAFTTLSVASTTPTNTSITIAVRAGNSPALSGGYTTVSNGDISAFAGYRYIQYQATLSTSNTSVTPTLDSVTINFTQYATSGDLTSSKYDTQDAANLISKLSWTASTSTVATTTFQIRSSADGVTWSGWCGFSETGPTCDGTNYFTDTHNGVTLGTSHPLRSTSGGGLADRYLQYKVFLSSDGSATPALTSLTVTYVVNAPPSFDGTFGTNGITVSQVSDSGSADYGKVLISYKIRDVDTSTGATNPGYVTPSFEYNVGAGWVALSSNLAVGDTSNKAVASTTYNTYTATWTASSTVTAYTASAQVRVTINDNEPANNTATATSAAFTLDTTVPVISSAVIDSSVGASTGSGNTAGTITLTITDSSAKQYRLCNDTAFPSSDTQGNSCAWTATTTTISGLAISDWVFTGANVAETVYLQARDAYGNVTSQTITATAMPTTLLAADVSNPTAVTYGETLSWMAVQNASSYKVYYATTSSSTVFPSAYTFLANSASNVYTHNITSATSSAYWYRVTAVSSNTDFSNFTVEMSAGDVPDSYGASLPDTTAPVISNISAPTASLRSTSAVITFTTDELATSTVLYGTSYLADCSYSSSKVTTSYVTSQSVTVDNLLPSTTYFYCVKAKDVLGNVSAPSTPSPTSFATVGGPTISSVTVQNLAGTSATIVWNTATSSDSYVYYSTSNSLTNPVAVGNTTQVSCTGPGVCQHQVGLSGLVAGTMYYFKVTSTDSDGNLVTDTNSGGYYSFTTLVDTTAPAIVGTIDTPVKAPTAAVIVWQTDEPATSQVNWGLASTSLTRFTAIDTTKSIYHVITLSSATTDLSSATQELTAETTYYFTVKSADAANNQMTSAVQSFTTPSSGNITVTTVVVSSGDTKDTTPPTVSNVLVSDITPFGATVTFDTSEDTDGFVKYGKDSSYGDTAGSDGWAKKHKINLRGLTLGTEYSIMVAVHDKAGNTGGSASQTFKTSFLSENLKDLTKIENIEAFQKEIENTIESILPSLVPPFVSKPIVTNITESGATLTFKTNIKAFPVVVYAEDGAFDESKENPYTGEISNTTEKASDHEINITGLKGNTKYHVQARGFSLPKVIGKSADVTFITKASKIAGSIVERRKDSFTVVWTTGEPTSSIVEYKDLKKGITGRKTDDAKKTSHSMKIENLPSGTAYEVSLSGMTEQGNIAEGGAPLSVTTSTDTTPPVISGFKVDNALVPGRTDRIQTIVSWITDEPSNGTVYYEEGAGTAGDTSELANKNELLDSYITQHSIILPSLKPGTIYRLKVVSNDDSGNEGTFGPRTVITPRQTESITDIIFKNFEDSFKFLRKI